MYGLSTGCASPTVRLYILYYNTDFQKCNTLGEIFSDLVFLIKFRGQSIRIPKVGYVKCHISKEITERIVSITVTIDKDERFYVTVTYEIKNPTQLPKTHKYIGLDMGIDSLVTTSDGIKYYNPPEIEKTLSKIKRLTRQLSRSEKDSNNSKKLQARINKLKIHLKNQRLDFTNKLTTQLIRDYDVIAIETLSPDDMRKNAKRKFRATDPAWGMIKRQLVQKAELYGKTCIMIDRYFPSSQICSVCGYRNRTIRDITIRQWTCPECNTHHDRDINAAQNILNKALKKA